MGIQCFKCMEYFAPSMSSVKIIGPDVEVTCPFCHTTTLDKLNKFACKQVGQHVPQSPEYARKAIKIAQLIELNSSDYYKKRGLRHGGTKKVRDLRNRESAA